MKYSYYPGCSLEGSAQEYDRATRSLMKALKVELTDIPDWSCCGATAAHAVDSLLALALPARNLALAQELEGSRDILVPCSACYLNLKQVAEKIRLDGDLKAQLNTILAEEELQLQNPPRVRHLLDVLATDITAAKIGAARRQNLAGLTIAPYYGCQCLRPYAVFDDPEAPHSMEPLIGATGARIHPWEMGGKCCGAGHMNTKPEVGMTLVAAILEAARGADAIVTVCPMCQLNLEAFQKRISRRMKRNYEITILYLPQLLGVALGVAKEELGLNLNLALTREFKARIAA
jgi:heterodisulfide reductase subunit B